MMSQGAGSDRGSGRADDYADDPLAREFADCGGGVDMSAMSHAFQTPADRARRLAEKLIRNGWKLSMLQPTCVTLERQVRRNSWTLICVPYQGKPWVMVKYGWLEQPTTEG